MTTRLRVLLTVAAILAAGNAAAEANIKTQLSAAIVQEIDLRQATLPEAIVALSNAVARTGAWVPIQIDPAASVTNRTITFSARRITLFEAITIIAEVTDFYCQFHENKVVFSAKCCPVDSDADAKGVCPHLTQQRYQSTLVTDALVGARDTPDWRHGDRPREPMIDAWLKEWIGNLGVRWHLGSSVSIDTNNSIITIINAPDEIEVFEGIFSHSDVTNWPKMKDLRMDAQHRRAW